MIFNLFFGMQEIEGDVSNLFLHMKVVQRRSLLLTREIFSDFFKAHDKDWFWSFCTIKTSADTQHFIFLPIQEKYQDISFFPQNQDLSTLSSDILVWAITYIIMI